MNPGNRGQRIRKCFAAARWQLQKRALARPCTLTLPNGVLFRAYPDCVVSSALTYADWPEYYELRLVREHLQSGQVVIDVGANVGHISLLLADIAGGAGLFAFEPAPGAFRRLAENWRINGWDTSRLFPVAVGSAAGRAFIPDLTVPLTTCQAAAEPGYGQHVDVHRVPLDEYRDRWRGRSIGFLKVDVEGDEASVLGGALATLNCDRPLLIMFESLGGRLQPEVADYLDRAGYEPFQLDDEGKIDWSRYDAQNLFAVPHERRQALLR